MSTERYRSGHNGADSKSAVRLTADRGFESHPLRQTALEIIEEIAGHLLKRLYPDSIWSPPVSFSLGEERHEGYDVLWQKLDINGELLPLPR